MVVGVCWLFGGSGDLSGNAWPGAIRFECRYYVRIGVDLKYRMNAPATASVHLGTPPQGYREWVTTKVHVHGFAELSAVRNVHVNSSEFIAWGNPWRLKLYPGGDVSSDTGWVAMYLVNQSSKEIAMKFGISVNDGNDKQMKIVSMQTSYTFGPVGSQSCGRGWPNFAKRSTIMDALVDGTLVVEVHMKSPTPIKAALPQFVPENPFNKNILQLFNDEESSDIVFQVGEHLFTNNAENDVKIAPFTFHAHCLILNNSGSTVLAELCEMREDPTTPIEIKDISPDVFRHLMYYIYGGKIPDDEMKSRAKEIINAANRYGVATLKLEAEACLVEGTTFCLENVMEHLIYADSMNCALLKEAVMDYIMENKAKVLEKISFDDAPGNLTRDLLAAVVRGEREEGGADGDNNTQFTTMRISELRQKAHEKGLDVDGSREMLIAVLKENS